VFLGLAGDKTTTRLTITQLHNIPRITYTSTPMDFFVSHSTLTSSNLPESGYTPSTPIDADYGNNGAGGTMSCIVALLWIVVVGYWLNANLMTFGKPVSSLSCLVLSPSFSSLHTAHAFLRILTRLPRNIRLPRVPSFPCCGE
jgi:hypothetical protein